MGIFLSTSPHRQKAGTFGRVPGIVQVQRQFPRSDPLRGNAGRPGNYGIHLDCIALRVESLGSALTRVREVLEDDDRHLAATLAGQREGESLRLREERIARLLDDPEKLRELRQQRAEHKAGEQQHKGRHWSMRI